MGVAVERLTSLVDSPQRFAIPYAELRQAQIDAMNERFTERKDRIRLLGHPRKGSRYQRDQVTGRHGGAALSTHRLQELSRELFDGEAMGSPGQVAQHRISPHPIASIETSDIEDIDQWISRLEAKGHYISCSSGTTGKSAMLIASDTDMVWSRLDTVGVFSWGSGVAPARDRRMFGVAPIADVPKNTNIAEAQAAAFGDPRFERFRLPVPPITVGQLTKMVVLRKAIAEGAARPGDIAEFEATSKARQQALDDAMIIAAESLVAARTDKLYISGLWNALYQVAKLV